MKKIFYSIAALAIAFFAGSCQKETIDPAAEGTKVTYTVTLPDAMQTKGEDGYDQYDLYYQVFKTIDAGELTTADELFHGKVLMDSNPKTVVLDLLNDQDYTILFWANKAGMDYFDISDLRNVGIKQAASNNDDRDAFCGYDQIDDFDAAMTKKVTLKRPFAQLNIATIVPNLQYSVKPNASYVKVAKVPVAYNVFTSSPVGADTEVEFTKNLIPGGTMTVNGTPYTKVAMNYVLVPESNVSVYYEIETDNGTVKNTVPNVPLKPNYRTNIIGNLLTSSASYIIEVLPGFDEPDMHVTVNEVTSSVDLEAALRQTDEHIVINLGNNAETKAAVEPMEYTVNVSSWKSMAFGGENTQTITINANGSKINFVQNDSNWSHVTLLNDDAKFIINDAVLTNSKYNSGHWHRNLIHFANEMELNDVKSEKGLCFNGNAVLNGLEINVADKNYAIWITAEGQTVNIDGLAVTATEAGRAIKIGDEGYEDEAQKVILNVKNARFTTAEKAAVLVSSCAGAEINWGEGNDIQAVAADPVNAVWVDEDWAAYFDLVTVNGATKMLEGSAQVNVIATADDLRAALDAAKDGDYIVLGDGTYEGLFFLKGKSINLSAMHKGKAVIDGKFAIAASGKTINLTGINFKNSYDGSVTTGHQYVDKTGNYCIGLYCASVNIKDCTFDLSKDGGVYYYAINNPEYCTVENCTFNCNGFRPILSQDHVSIKDNTFYDQYRYAVQIYGNECNGTGNVIFEGNKIINPCQTSKKPFAAGISIAGSKSFFNSRIQVADNTIESAIFPELVYTYEAGKNGNVVDMTKVTVTGAEFITEEEAENK